MSSASPTPPRRIATIVTVFAVVVCVAVVPNSCSESEPEPPANPKLSAKPKVVPLDLPDGKSDQYGPLPDTVSGWKVTKGAAPGYVSDESCKECHESLYESYQHVGMSKSFYRPGSREAVEDFAQTFHHEKTDFYYEMSVRDGKYYQKRYCKDDDGERFAEHEAEVAWVIGSGNKIRTYLSQSPHGNMYQLPVSWYKGKGWRMSPGYDFVQHDRFERVVTRECMFCHNAYPEVPVGSDLGYSQPTFPQELPEGVGCQRCHGPGARHVEIAADEDATDEEIRARVLNPANFPDRQREDLCMTCHLQPESMVGELTPHTFDTPTYSHRPDKNLTDYVVPLDHGTEAARRSRIEINHHAYRLRWSKCYTASGKLTCLSCHDPHRKVPESERVAFYRSKCVQCHKLDECKAEEMGKTLKPAESDCVSCHMVAARPEDVVQVTITDHFIRRGPPEVDLTAPRPEAPNEPEPVKAIAYLGERSGGDPMFGLHVALAHGGVTTPEGMREMRRVLASSKPRTPTAHLAVIGSLIDGGDLMGAAETAADGLARFPDVAGLHSVMGETLLRMDRLREAKKFLEAALTLDATEPGTHHALGRVHAQLGKTTLARASYEKSLKLRPNSWLVWLHYASALLQLGEFEDAIKAGRQAIARNPNSALPYLLLSDIHKLRSDWPRMLKVLGQGGSRAVPVKLDLVVALLFVGDAKHRDPERAFAMAVELAKENPKNGRCHMHHALASLITDRPEGVDDMIAKARANGADPGCCFALTALFRIGKRDVNGANEALSQFGSHLRNESEERLRPVLEGVVRASAGGPRKNK